MSTPLKPLNALFAGMESHTVHVSACRESPCENAFEVHEITFGSGGNLDFLVLRRKGSSRIYDHLEIAMALREQARQVRR